jgi:hypothetical protein
LPYESQIFAKNVAETYKICESSETHTSQKISCISVAEIKLKLANLGGKAKRNKDKLIEFFNIVIDFFNPLPAIINQFSMLA